MPILVRARHPRSKLMPKLLARIIATLLVPCLIADPVSSTALHNPLSPMWETHHATGGPAGFVAGGGGEAGHFASQALALPSGTVGPGPVVAHLNAAAQAARIADMAANREESGAEALNREVAKLLPSMIPAEREEIRKRIDRILWEHVPRSEEEKGFVQTIVEVLWQNMSAAVDRLNAPHGFDGFYDELKRSLDLDRYKKDFVDRPGRILDTETLAILLNGGKTDKPLWRAPEEHEKQRLGEAYEAMIEGAARGAYEVIVGSMDILHVGIFAWRRGEEIIRIAMEFEGYEAHGIWNLEARQGNLRTGGVVAVLAPAADMGQSRPFSGGFLTVAKQTSAATILAHAPGAPVQPDPNRHHRGWIPHFAEEAPFMGAGVLLLVAAWVSYPLLGWASGAPFVLGLGVIVVGRPIFQYFEKEWNRRMDGDLSASASIPETLAVERRDEWKHFRKSIASMAVFEAFCLWRASVTAWRPVKDRFYPFDHGGLRWFDQHVFGGALRHIDHGQVNDFLMIPAPVAGTYLVLTLMYAIAGYLTRDSGTIFNLNQAARNDSWANHKRKLQTILFVTIALMLQAGWLEKIRKLGGHVWDTKDVFAEGGGAVVAVWMILSLSYPFLARVPAFSPEAPAGPDPKSMRWRYFFDSLGMLMVAAYIFAGEFLIDPSAWTPMTAFDRYTFPLEIVCVFFICRYVLKRNIQRPPDFTWMHLNLPLGSDTSDEIQSPPAAPTANNDGTGLEVTVISGEQEAEIISAVCRKMGVPLPSRADDHKRYAYQLRAYRFDFDNGAELYLHLFPDHIEIAPLYARKQKKGERMYSLVALVAKALKKPFYSDPLYAKSSSHDMRELSESARHSWELLVKKGWAHFNPNEGRYEADFEKIPPLSNLPSLPPAVSTQHQQNVPAAREAA